MRRRLHTALIFVLLSSGSVKAQERKEISQTQNEGRYIKTKEVYSVLKVDASIKDGPYQLFWNGNLQKSGYYKNNQKDSLWQAYQPRSGALLSRKWYTDGKRSGIWEFYDNRAEVMWTYDFDNAKATFQKPSGKPDSAYYQTDAGDWILGPVDHRTLPLVSSWEWLNFLNRSLRYPDEAVNNEQGGKVIISITVNEHGEAIDYAIQQSAAPSLDQEALRVVKLFSFEFVPAEKDGKKIKSQVLQPIIFKLDGVTK